MVAIEAFASTGAGVGAGVGVEAAATVAAGLEEAVGVGLDSSQAPTNRAAANTPADKETFTRFFFILIDFSLFCLPRFSASGENLV
jgi:hypothetical protein